MIHMDSFFASCKMTSFLDVPRLGKCCFDSLETLPQILGELGESFYVWSFHRVLPLKDCRFFVIRHKSKVDTSPIL